MMPAYTGFRSPQSPSAAPDAANEYLLIDIIRNRFGAQNISTC